jgi:hypothetical protein
MRGKGSDTGKPSRPGPGRRAGPEVGGGLYPCHAAATTAVWHRQSRRGKIKELASCDNLEEWRDMSKFMLDPDLRAKSNGLTEQVEFCDEKGETVGRFLPESHYRKLLYAAADACCPYSPEELKRRSQEEGGLSLAEILKNLGVQ